MWVRGQSIGTADPQEALLRDPTGQIPAVSMLMFQVLHDEAQPELSGDRRLSAAAAAIVAKSVHSLVVGLPDPFDYGKCSTSAGPCARGFPTARPTG